MPPPFSLPSFAKVNLSLRIIGQRDDGFHELCTIFQTVSLHDTISFKEDAGSSLSCEDASVPTDDRNLIIRAAEALRRRFPATGGAAIRLDETHILARRSGRGVVERGCRLLVSSRLWQLVDARRSDSMQMAAALGADVPFFLHGGTAIGTGRGDLIEPVSDNNVPDTCSS